jgi:hypothetical protein
MFSLQKEKAPREDREELVRSPGNAGPFGFQPITKPKLRETAAGALGV